MPGERFVEHHTSRVDVGALGGFAGQLLRRHIARRADAVSHLREAAGLLVRPLRDPEIKEQRAIPCEQDVTRLYIPMDHAVLVGGLESGEHVITELEHFVGRHPPNPFAPLSLDSLLQRFSVD